MSKEKQIEEMANDINMHCCSLAEQFCGETSCNACLTNFLYNAGYRKQSEIEKLKNKLFKEVFEGVLFSLVYLGADGKWHTKRNNAEKTTAIIERYLKLVAIEKGGAE